MSLGGMFSKTNGLVVYSRNFGVLGSTESPQWELPGGYTKFFVLVTGALREGVGVSAWFYIDLEDWSGWTDSSGVKYILTNISEGYTWCALRVYNSQYLTVQTNAINTSIKTFLFTGGAV